MSSLAFRLGPNAELVGAFADGVDLDREVVFGVGVHAPRVAGVDDRVRRVGLVGRDERAVRLLDQDVEVLDADSVQVEEMAKKKENFDEEDLDKLEDRPPVITIMGHVDHGKVATVCSNHFLLSLLKAAGLS